MLIKIEKQLTTISLLLISLAFLPGQAKSQSTSYFYLPPAFSPTKSGEEYTGIPFSRSATNRAYRTQWVYWRPCFAKAKNVLMIDGITLRSRPNQTYKYKPLIPMTLYVSSITAELGNMSDEFRKNQGINMVEVFNTMFTLPTQTLTTAGTFNIKIPFQRPFLYQTSDPGLLLDFMITNQPPGTYDLDLAKATTGDHTSFGASSTCISYTTGKPLTIKGKWVVLAGNKLFIEVTNGPPSIGTNIKQLLGFMGGSTQGSWFGNPLPMDLGLFGAPGCTILTNPLVYVPGQTDKNGYAMLGFPLPHVHELVGETIYSQVMMFDAHSNQLGLVLSNGVASKVSGPYPVARLSSVNVYATKGTNQVGSVPVIRLSVH